MFKIKTFNKISDKGLSRFNPASYTVSDSEATPDAVVLRSQKFQNETLSDSVLAVARAGAGVNNVPVDEYTQKGRVVFNTPGANANAVKELVIAGMLLSSRGILEGKAYVETLGDMTCAQEMSQLLEKEKKRFAGSELAGKTLGIIGLGAIGSMVANAALALDMDVVGFDPALSVEAAWRLSSDVRRAESVQALLAQVDYVSLHVPAIEATKHLINSETLSVMKPTAVVLNFAREAIVNPEDIVSALNNNALRQYICDFPEPCLIGHDKVIAVPHIGASTAEAEENCAVMAANQVIDFLENGNILNSVNFPFTSMPRAQGAYRLTFTNKNVSGVLGNVLSVFTEHNLNIIDMVNKSRGEIAYNILDLESAPSEAVLAEIAKVDDVIACRALDS